MTIKVSSGESTVVAPVDEELVPPTVVATSATPEETREPVDEEVVAAIEPKTISIPDDVDPLDLLGATANIWHITMNVSGASPQPELGFSPGTYNPLVADQSGGRRCPIGTAGHSYRCEVGEDGVVVAQMGDGTEYLVRGEFVTSGKGKKKKSHFKGIPDGDIGVMTIEMFVELPPGVKSPEGVMPGIDRYPGLWPMNKTSVAHFSYPKYYRDSERGDAPMGVSALGSFAERGAMFLVIYPGGLTKVIEWDGETGDLVFLEDPTPEDAAILFFRSVKDMLLAEYAAGGDVSESLKWLSYTLINAAKIGGEETLREFAEFLGDPEHTALASQFDARALDPVFRAVADKWHAARRRDPASWDAIKLRGVAVHMHLAAPRLRIFTDSHLKQCFDDLGLAKKLLQEARARLWDRGDRYGGRDFAKDSRRICALGTGAVEAVAYIGEVEMVGRLIGWLQEDEERGWGENASTYFYQTSWITIADQVFARLRNQDLVNRVGERRRQVRQNLAGYLALTKRPKNYWAGLAARLEALAGSTYGWGNAETAEKSIRDALANIQAAESAARTLDPDKVLLRSGLALAALRRSAEFQGVDTSFLPEEKRRGGYVERADTSSDDVVAPSEE